MKKVSHQLIYVLLIVSVLTASCSTGKSMGGTSKKCGCGLNKGYVGY
jgi:predicted small secreted protein